MEQNDISSRIVFADRGKVNVEKGVEFAPKFDQNGLIPALAMDHITHEPLMLAYMNAESLRMTMELGEAVYYSRSRQEIWHKPRRWWWWKYPAQRRRRWRWSRPSERP